MQVERGDELVHERHGLTQFARLQQAVERVTGPRAWTEPDVAAAHLGCQPTDALTKAVGGPAAQQGLQALAGGRVHGRDRGDQGLRQGLMCC